MSFKVVYKRLAQMEVAEAHAWYAQPYIDMAEAFFVELGRTDNFLASNPHLYPLVEKDVRRANLQRFPYSLFYVIDGDEVIILSCFHQHRDPQKRAALLPDESSS